MRVCLNVGNSPEAALLWMTKEIFECGCSLQLVMFEKEVEELEVFDVILLKEKN